MNMSQLFKALWFQIFAALVLGLIVGATFKGAAFIPYLEPLGGAFMGLIKMMIVPIVFASIVSAVSEADDLRELGKVGLKTFSLYLGTTAFAIAIAMTIAHFSGLEMSVDAPLTDPGAGESGPDTPLLVRLIPANLGGAFLEPNYLQIIIFSLILGVGISAVGEPAEPVRAFFSGFNAVNMTIIGGIMRLAPLGVFAIALKMGSSKDPAEIANLFGLIGLMYFICLFHVFTTYAFILKFFTDHSFFRFIKQIFPAQMMAYSTASSAATLPLTMQTAQQRVGLRPGTVRMTLPLGATLNMDGTAMYIGAMTVVFGAGMGIDFTAAQYLWIISVTVLASVGTASVPSAGLVMMAMIFDGVGLPTDEIVLLVLGVDRIIDMMRTAVNVTGDLVVCAAVDHRAGDIVTEMQALPSKSA